MSHTSSHAPVRTIAVTPADTPADAAADASRLSRRRMFIAGAGVAGAAAIAGAHTVEAADGANALIGELNEGADGATIFENTNPGATDLAGDENALSGLIDNVANGSHAVTGATKGAGHSIAGDTPADAEDGAGGPNVTAATWGNHGGAGAGVGGVSVDGYGGEFVGGKSHLRLIQTEDDALDGPPTGDGHLLGELYADGAGNLWFNQADGENFTRLNNQGGIVLLPNSQRAFDSRDGQAPDGPNKGRFDAKESRKIDLNEFTDVPDGAQAMVANVTAAETGAPGFLTIFSGDLDESDKPQAATVNWLDAGENINNGVTINVGADGSAWVFAEGDTHVVIDIVGYVT